VLGPSGSGKSTLINLLVPGATVLTGEISQALNSGKHTTTSTTGTGWMGHAPRR
jgi:ribosome biogenesis GTPase